MTGWKRAALILLSVFVVISAFSACGSNADDSLSDSGESQNSTTEEITYEKQTVYLCTGYTTVQNESGSTRSYEFDYDEYGHFTKYVHILDGEVLENKGFRYDYEEGIVYEDRYTADGVLNVSGQTSMEAVNFKIGGMAGTRNGQFTYNDDGYVIEEIYNGWKYVSTYNEDYTTFTEYAHKEGEESYLSREGTLDGKGNLLTEYYYREDGSKSVTKIYAYDDAGRILRIDTDIHSEYVPYSYPTIYTYDEHGNLIKYDVDYYYGYETTYEYKAYEIFVPVTKD